MSINNATLKALIVTELQGQGFTTSDGNGFAYAERMATAIANAIVTHLTANLQIKSGTTTDTAGGHTHTLNGVVGGKII